MFSQWLLVICSLFFVGNGGKTTEATTGCRVKEVCEVSKIVQADMQYGWQVSGSSISAYDVPAN